MATKRNSRRFSVYVIELDRKVLEENKFREANPEHKPEKPCVYVGMTSRSPEKRFEQHLSGYKASKYPKRYGVRLRPRLFTRYNPMTYEEAQRQERHLAEKLRKRGYAVWQK
ncbi:MAG: hypothetical protein CMO26_06255 [Thiotrichales bacterium]|nr:hypothetical protein [Thiotrichales bacterium]